MREEISGAKQWRLSPHGGAGVGSSWASRRCRSQLPAELVDAAFEEETGRARPVRGSRRDLPRELPSGKSPGRPDIVESLSTQLAMLEMQREQLQKLLDDAQAAP